MRPADPAVAEPILDPDLAIVDPHHHLWDRAGHRYRAEELLADLDSGHRIVATAYVECLTAWRAEGPEALRPRGETAFVMDELGEPLATGRGPTDAAAAIVAFADLALGDAVAPVLDAHAKIAGERFRGVRYATAWHEGDAVRSHYPTRPAMLREAEVQAGIRTLGRRGLTFDVWSYFTQLPDVLAALDACPDTLFVLDHCGGPIGIGPWAGRRDDALTLWRPAIRELARRRNIVVKLGGLGMPLAGFGFHKRERRPSSLDLAEAWSPYILHCIDSFGPDRCMFESNWPVDASAGGYATVWNAFKRIGARFAADERRHLFSEVARSTYGIRG